jgi:hypothetical protein
MKKSKVNENLYTKKKSKQQTGILSYNSELLKNSYANKYSIFVGTPTLGLVRIEWALSRFGQVVPCNFSLKTGFVPFGYSVADAQNLIVRKFIEENCEWLFIVEEDNILPSDCFLRLNDYMRSKEVPIVSGLYTTKSIPSEPMVYRGRGNSYFTDWKIGDKVWVDAVPTGCILIHRSILEYLWNNSPEYKAGDQVTRRVFYTPEVSWFDPEKGTNNAVGTSDMEFCARVIMDNVFEKTGWSKFSKMQYPFLIDTNIFTYHILPSGQTYPSPQELEYWKLDPKKRPSLIQGNGSNILKKENKNARTRK